MTNGILASIVADGVEKAMKSCEDTITEELADGLGPDDYVDPVAALMIIKSMRLTAQMTAQLTIRILEAHGCIKLPPDGDPVMYLVDEPTQD